MRRRSPPLPLRRSLPCAIIFICFAGLPIAGMLRAETASRYFGRSITRIDYLADQPLDRAHYDQILALTPGDTLTHTALKTALQNLYDTGRFSTLAADAEDENGGVRLVFNLKLNYYFNSFEIKGKVDLGGKALWEVVQLPVGQHFTEEGQEKARMAVEKYFHDQGYFQAKVRAQIQRDPNSRQIDTFYEVSRGELATISSVEIKGVPSAEERPIRDKFGFRPGVKYHRSRLRRRLEGLKDYFVGRGNLGAVPAVVESYHPVDNSIGLVLEIRNFGKVRVTVRGYKIDRTRLRSLLPVLSGEGLDPDLLEEGERNLKEYLEEQGHPEATVDNKEEMSKRGTLVLRYEINAGKKITVAEVSFEGNKAIQDKELLAAIQIQPARVFQSSVYSIAKLDSDIDSLTTLYNSRGYLFASIIPLVTLQDGSDRLTIKFVCEEGPQSSTRSVKMSGNSTLSVSTLESKMELKPGKPYSPHIAERDRQALLAAYNDAGFLHARVTYHAGEADEKHSVPVEFDIEEGSRSYVDEIMVLGNLHSRDAMIEKRISLRKDGPLSLGKMLDTQRALYNTGVFDRVRVTQQNPESTTPYQDVVVRLDESRRNTFRYGFGYQEREKLRGTLEFSQLNILGTGLRADLNIRGSRIEQLGVLNIQQPRYRYLSVDSYLTLSAQSQKEVAFDVKRYNISYQFSRPVSSHAWTLFRYNFRNVRVSNVQDVQPAREDTPRNLSTFSVIYLNDTRDNYLDPEKGFFTSTDLSLTPKLLGSNSYFSLYTQNTYYRKLARRVLGVAAFRFGFLQPYGSDVLIPISERFFAGGSSSLRGFDTDMAGPISPSTNEPIGGNALIIGNLEARIPLIKPLSVAGFYDGGNVFQNLGTIRLSGISHTIGLGLRIKTPFGPLRLDYGFNLNLPDDLKNRGFKSGHFFVTVGPLF